MPSCDASLIYHTLVDAPAEETYAAVRAIDFAHSFDHDLLVRAMSTIRRWPEHLVRRLRGRPLTMPTTMTIDEITTAGPAMLLDEAPGVEIVLGLIGKLWQATIPYQRVAADDFVSFDEPGYGKLAFSLAAQPHGNEQSVLTIEARIATTDRAAHTHFRRYWRIIGPGARLIARRLIAAVRADAEDRYLGRLEADWVDEFGPADA
jgi:hypothetical protein